MLDLRIVVFASAIVAAMVIDTSPISGCRVSVAHSIHARFASLADLPECLKLTETRLQGMYGDDVICFRVSHVPAASTAITAAHDERKQKGRSCMNEADLYWA